LDFLHFPKELFVKAKKVFWHLNEILWCIQFPHKIDIFTSPPGPVRPASGRSGQERTGTSGLCFDGLSLRGKNEHIKKSKKLVCVKKQFEKS
jgi:hypothetical protein